MAEAGFICSLSQTFQEQIAQKGDRTKW